MKVRNTAGKHKHPSENTSEKKTRQNSKCKSFFQHLVRMQVFQLQYVTTEWHYREDLFQHSCKKCKNIYYTA